MAQGGCVDTDECSLPAPGCEIGNQDEEVGRLLAPYLNYVTSCAALKTLPHKHLADSCAAVDAILQANYQNVPPIAVLCGCQCAATPCQNGATCSESSTSAAVGKGKYHCTCRGQWGGTACDDLHECNTAPCGAHGTCAEHTGEGNRGFTCTCRSGWAGTTCDAAVCASAPCQHGGSCIADSAVCNDGPGCVEDAGAIQRLGLTCADLDVKKKTFGPQSLSLATYCPLACAGKPCSPGAMLAASSGLFTCACTPLFMGVHCERDRVQHVCGDDRDNCPALLARAQKKAGSVVAGCASFDWDWDPAKPCADATDTGRFIGDDPASCSMIRGYCGVLDSVTYSCPVTCGVCGAGVTTSPYRKMLSSACCASCKPVDLHPTTCARAPASVSAVHFMPVDSVAANYTIKTLVPTSLELCEKACCADNTCLGFAFEARAGRCVLKNTSGACECYCDDALDTAMPTCAMAQRVPKCTQLCQTTSLVTSETFYRVQRTPVTPGQN